MNETSTNIRQKEAIKSKNNPHVKWLSIDRPLISPHTGKPHLVNRKERREAQFFLRRAWACSILESMKLMNWDKINKATGRTRNTWKNVTESIYLTRDEHQKLLHENKELCNRGTNDAKELKDLASQIAEVQGRLHMYRPVTDGFIRKVTETLESYNYVIATDSFVKMYWLGLECFKLGQGQDPYILNRIGDTLKEVDDDGGGIGQFMDIMMTDWGDGYNNRGTTFIHCTRSHRGEPVRMDAYPILEVEDRDFGAHKCFHYHETMEGRVFPIIDESTGEPDPRAILSHDIWEHCQGQEAWEAGQSAEPPMQDPNVFKDKFDGYTVEQLEDMIQIGILDQGEGLGYINAAKAREYENNMDEVFEREDAFKEDSEMLQEIALEAEQEEKVERANKRMNERVKNGIRKKVRVMNRPLDLNLSFSLDPEYKPLSDGKVELKVVLNFKDGKLNGQMIQVKE